MSSASSGGHGSRPLSRIRRAVPWVALGIALCAIAGLFLVAARAHRDILDRSNQAVAESAAAFLATVTPAPGGRFDPARLVSGAGALSGAWFFPGGLELVVGHTALLPDTLGLTAVTDSITLAADAGSITVELGGGHRGAAAPFVDPQGSAIGWLIVWDTMPGLGEPREAILFGMLSFCIAVWLGVATRRGASRLHRDLLVLLTAGAAALAGFALETALERSAESATVTHLQLTRRFIEMASTADGVRSASLLHLAPGLLLERLRTPVARLDSVEWLAADQERLGSLVAIRPTGGAFRLTSGVARLELDRAHLTMLGVWGLLLVSLLVAADARPPSTSATPFQ